MSRIEKYLQLTAKKGDMPFKHGCVIVKNDTVILV